MRGNPRWFFPLLLLNLLLLLTGTALSSLLVIYHTILYVEEVEPPIKLYKASAPATLGPNLTSASISYNITTNYYDAVIYGSFDEGFAGWAYSEYDPLNVLYGYWYLEGFIGLNGSNVPAGWGYYGWHLVYTNLSFTGCPVQSIDFSINMSVYKDWFTTNDINITIAIYDFNSSSWVYTIDTILVSWLYIGYTGWSTRIYTLTWRPIEGHVYALAVNVTAPEGWLIPYTYIIFLDDIHVVVTCNTYAVSDLEALNVTDTSGIYEVRLVLVDTSGSGNASITLINGAYASTPVSIVNGAPSSYSTSFIRFNSSDILLRSGFILVDASLDAGATLQVSLKLEYTTGAIRVYYPVNITLNATP